MSNLEYKKKYFKYKTKYINLKNEIEQDGGIKTTWPAGNYIIFFNGSSLQNNDFLKDLNFSTKDYIINKNGKKVKGDLNYFISYASSNKKQNITNIITNLKHYLDHLIH